MRRFGVIVALGAMLGMLAGALVASPALAGRGHKWEIVESGPFTLPAKFCGFKMRVTPAVDKEFIKVLKTADGSVTTLITGSRKTTFTNLSTGKAITANMTAALRMTTHADGSVTVKGTGHPAMLLSPADAKRFGLPTVFVPTGNLRASAAADGTITSLSLRGHVLVDVCAALS
jgi:hypothetical protein